MQIWRKVTTFVRKFINNTMGIISKYASLVKFSHTVFAMPFALIGYVYALRSTGTPFEWLLLVEVLLCMVFARNAAMGFNRWADRKIDAANPRTAGREIPAGKVSPRAAIWFVVANVALFIAVAAFINRLTLILSPIALLVLLGYSYTKRFTAWSHIVLGMALAIAPVGAYIAVTGTVAIAPVVLAALVLTWVAGFDIIYASADAEFDRTHGLHSIPARFKGRGASVISILLHLVTIYAVVMFGLFTSRGTVYWIGAAIFVALLILQHTSRRLAFDWVNGAASIAFATLAIADLLA
jgi:4-hydroxybenzoate polyprenyltransferase